MKITKYELEQVLSYLSYADKMMAIAKVQKSQVMQTEAIQNAQEALFDLKHFLDFSISEVEDDDKASKSETFAEYCARDIEAEEKIKAKNMED